MRRTRIVAWAGVVGLAWLASGCRRESSLPQAAGPDGLAAHASAALRAIARDSENPGEATVAADIAAGWKLRPDEFTARLTPGYRDLHAEYAAGFDAATGALARQLAEHAQALAHGRARVVIRTQYADDLYLSPAMVRLRWALPVGEPGLVAFVAPVADADAIAAGTAPAAVAEAARVDAVFVRAGTRWRALIGFDAAVRRVVRARADDDCLDRLDPDCRAGRCSHETYRIFHAAVTGGDVTRACAAVAPAAP